MATGAEAIEAIVTATGIPPATVARAARTLKEAGGDLWPKGKPGGGINAAHVQPHHLAYLLIALMATDTMSLAADAAAEHAALPCAEQQRPEEWQTFGGLLTSLIHLSMFEEGRSEVRKMVNDVAVYRGDGMASVGIRIDGEKVRRVFYQTQTPTAEEDIPPAHFRVRAGFPCEIFAILADLALHSQRAAAYRDTGSIPVMVEVEPQADFAGERTDHPAQDPQDPARKIETPTPKSTGPAFLDAKSQPGANPVNVDPHSQRSDEIAGTQSSTSRPGSLRRPHRAHHGDAKEEAMTPHHLTIADTARILNAKFGVSTTYMKVHTGVTSGIIPAERPPSGKGWVILESDLPTIAALLKAKPKAA
jgi:hypothetical protein